MYKDIRLPDVISGLRIVLMPVIIFLHGQGHTCPAFWLFAAAALTDWLDGFLARRLKIQSRFGAIADPVADKVLAVGVIGYLLYAQIFPLALFMLIVIREILITAGAFYAMRRLPRLHLSARPAGKLHTFLLFPYLALLLSGMADGWLMHALYNICLAMTVISGADYILFFCRSLRESVK